MSCETNESPESCCLATTEGAELGAPKEELPTYLPPADAWEGSDGILHLELELPGIPAEELKVSYEEGILSIEGTPKPLHEGRRVLRHGLRRALARRRFRLDEELDPESIKARFERGLLELSIARRAASKPRRIELRH